MRLLWSWSHGSWIYYYLCNQCLSPLDTTLCDKVCQWLATGRWFSQGTSVSTTNKTDRHDITEILLQVALNTITITLTPDLLPHPVFPVMLNHPPCRGVPSLIFCEFLIFLSLQWYQVRGFCVPFWQLNLLTYV